MILKGEGMSAQKRRRENGNSSALNWNRCSGTYSHGRTHTPDRNIIPADQPAFNLKDTLLQNNEIY